MSDALKFRKRPVVVEAFRWTADRNQTEDPEWIVSAIHAGIVFFRDRGTEHVKLVIATLEGHMVADRGDWIIRGVKGELYPCKPDIFAATYEAVTDNLDPAEARDEASSDLTTAYMYAFERGKERGRAERLTENDELRAAIEEWAEADQAGPGTAKGLNRLWAAEDNLRRLAGKDEQHGQ